MRETLAHRGPDGADTSTTTAGRAGFRRLAIIDPPPRRCSRWRKDGSVRLVFNGEIYNHAEIRKELEQLGGHRFRTDHSDTEGSCMRSSSGHRLTSLSRHVRSQSGTSVRRSLAWCETGSGLPLY
jgi:hypothetical protein